MAKREGPFERLGRGADRLVDELGPGVVTGAADDDPSGIATYSQAGAQFGYGLLWTILLTYPLMAAVQLVSAHIGRVTGAGLAKNFMRFFPKPVVTVLVAILLAANVFNMVGGLSETNAAQTHVNDTRAAVIRDLYACVDMTMRPYCI